MPLTTNLKDKEYYTEGRGSDRGFNTNKNFGASGARFATQTTTPTTDNKSKASELTTPSSDDGKLTLPDVTGWNATKWTEASLGLQSRIDATKSTNPVSNAESINDYLKGLNSTSLVATGTTSGYRDGFKNIYETSDMWKVVQDMLDKGYIRSDDVQKYFDDADSAYQNYLNVDNSQMMADYDAYRNRDSFSYDAGKDSMWQSYLSSAMDSGKIAMADTMGQASDLTGGYGSSYATSAGAQAYNQYIKEAYSALPEYYQMALNAYNAEGDRLLKNYEMSSGIYNQKKSDAYNDYAILNDKATRAEDNERSDWNTTLNGNLTIANADSNLNVDMLNRDDNITKSELERADSNYWKSQSNALGWAELAEDARQFDAKQSADTSSSSESGGYNTSYTRTQLDTIVREAKKALEEGYGKNMNADGVEIVKNFLLNNYVGVFDDDAYLYILDALEGNGIALRK